MRRLPRDAVTQSADIPGQSQEKPSSAERDVPRPLTLHSEDLLAGRTEVWIEHRGERYRLRLTSSGKLYLTK